jgi:hypothetical protein
LAILTCGVFAVPVAGQTVTTNIPPLVPSGQDWATMSMQNPIDMNQWNDVSWWVYSVDGPSPGLVSVRQEECSVIPGGTQAGSSCFKATTQTAAGNIWILETPIPFTADIHKSGLHFPINADVYKTVAFRMRLNSGGVCTPAVLNGTPAFPQCTTSFLWNNTNLYDGQPVTNTGALFTHEGWGIYFIDMAKVAYAGTPNKPWSGTIQDLRYTLQNMAGAQVEIDWIRLVPNNLTDRTITWSGFGGSVDIYLDNNASAADGFQGLMFKQDNSSSRVKAASGSYSFQPGALAPGTYYVAVCPAARTAPTSGCTYTQSPFVVNDVPTLTFTAPSPEGGEDFATAVLGNAWDMTALSDIDFYRNSPGGVNSGLVATTVNAHDEAGVPLGNVSALYAPGSASGDPYLYPLWFAPSASGVPVNGRGQTHKIDANKYHILTIEAGIPQAPRDLNGGSIARVVWQVTGERNGGNPRENVSADLVFNHRAGFNVMTKFTADMKTLKLETDPGASPSTTGWTSTIESFRFDPHEAGVAPSSVFGPSVPFYVRRIKLAANERATGTYNITWSYADAISGGTPALTLAYDTDTNPASGRVQIAAGINPWTGVYSWNTAGVPSGTYYIHATFTDGQTGQVTNSTYSRWPIIVGPLVNITATPTNLRIIATKSGATLPFKSPPQEVLVSMTGASAAWTATASQPWVQINNGSGTGSGRFSVEVVNPGDVIGGSEFLNATITIASGANTTIVPVNLRIKPAGTSDNPFGSFDTPASSAAPLEGSFALGGWALDDIGIQRVSIWRDRAPGETTPVDANGKIFIADAFFVSGARPDIESAFSDHPFARRAGWGYLLLSWGLFNQGNGPFALYAYAHDVEGHVIPLGSKSIVVRNATATKPFGSIDVPSYGGTMSGVNYNFGWALTPNAAPPCVINNGNVFVALDSGPLAAVNYGANRPDIQAAFPGFSNGANSGGSYLLNTTAITNGTHQIGWYVVDSCGRAEGIGSRFFQVLNGGSVTTPTEAAAAVQSAAIEDPRAVEAVSTDPVVVERHDFDTHLSYPNLEGTRVVGVEQGQRVEVQLPQIEGATYEGHRVGGIERTLPLGSSLDARTGVFYWEPVAGFLGTFELEFIATKGAAKQMTKVRVVVGPSMRTAIDTPWSGGEVQQPFLVGGWTADLAATDGAGIDTVHVWAFPTGGGEPTFLGVAAIGDSRPDVAAVYGKQFEDSSFNLIASGLKPGAYDVVVYPHRVETNAFAGALAVRITVR